MNSNIIEIEISAEKLYYTIIGQKSDMINLLESINKKNKLSDTTFIISRLIVPLANIIDNYSDKTIILPPEAEQIQCCVLCDCDIKEEKEVYTLLCLTKHDTEFILNFPEIDLKEDFEPEKIIMDDIKKNFTIVPTPIKNTLKLIDITGNDSDILVYVARTSNKNKLNIYNK
ncbi:hypothetical protein Catovirus_1_896 [Catovirus CTV1]|uniref:Uncharacterized protein n=1 Tax=Catovirus CTV1 TaxID=1977631 RepID=A0A1V0SAX0_9VIRU|nr:hypothetical protein Catovirus_1_896 [Catovirus CTV1]